MALIKCNECGNEVSSMAATCPKCGAKFKWGQSTARVVSPVKTFFFGCFYFLYKGWPKAAVAALALAVITGGLALFILPFYAKTFVDYLEGPE